MVLTRHFGYFIVSLLGVPGPGELTGRHQEKDWLKFLVKTPFNKTVGVCCGLTK